MKYFKNRIQIFNPKGKCWVKIDTKVGKIIGHKETPYKNIKRRTK